MGLGGLGWFCGEKGRSHRWIRVQARSLTALWMGIMEGIVRARVSVLEVEDLLEVVGRDCGLCLCRTAEKNWCSEGYIQLPEAWGPVSVSELEGGEVGG